MGLQSSARVLRMVCGHLYADMDMAEVNKAACDMSENKYVLNNTIC